MSNKNELQPNEEELDIIAGARIPTKKELQAMRAKFKDDKEIIESLEGTKTVD